MGHKLHIAIIGAGIAGLAGAIALTGKGHRIEVFEAAPQLQPVGAGLQLGPNAIRALKQLGVWQALAPSITRPTSIRIGKAGTGNALKVLPLQDGFEQTYGEPYALVHRADLLSALLDRAQSLEDVEIRFGAPLQSLNLQQPQQPALVFPHGTVRCDLAIAADGVRSMARDAIAPSVAPVISEGTLFRAMCPASAWPAALDPQAVHLWLGARAHAVAYAVSGGEHINIVASLARAPQVAGWSAPATPAEVTAAFPGANPTLQHLLNAPAEWKAWSAADIEPFRGWSSGHAVLIGDAAHATLPHLAQGAAMALEDALALAEALDGAPSLPAALASFEQARFARTARIIRASRANGRIYKLTGAAALVRDLAIRLIPAPMQLARNSWIYRQ